MKFGIVVLALVAFVTATRVALAQNPPVIITVQSAASSGQPITFFGSLTNTTPHTLSIDFVSFFYNEVDAFGDPFLMESATQPILPVTLAPSESLTDLPLFTLEFSGTTVPDVYTGNFILQGTDLDSLDFYSSGTNTDGSPNVSNGAFSVIVTTVPEAQSWQLLGIGLMGIAGSGQRLCRKDGECL